MLKKILILLIDYVILFMIQEEFDLGVGVNKTPKE